MAPSRQELSYGVVGPKGFVLQQIDYVPVWVSPSVVRLIRPSALQAAFRDHQYLAGNSRLPIFSSWYELPLIGRHVRGSRLRVGFRTQHDFSEILVGLEKELPRRRGGRPRRRR